MDEQVQTVHVVAKTHLDLGFTALAAEVVDQYLGDFFPRAIEAAEALERRGGAERLTWTTGSWILHRALTAGRQHERDRVDRAIQQGHLAWHAFPVTTHTELMDAQLVRAGLGISAELDARFGVTTTAAKMTDVPGHTRGLVPLLAEAGVTLLHVGVNPAWPVPEVPLVFRWRSPDGAEVTVAYRSGGYGGDLVVPGCRAALAFVHTGDNLGPPSADEVIAAHAEIQQRFPDAEVRASTLDGFARALGASGAEAALPVVTAEIGDPWLFGAGSDPQKVAGYRALLRNTSGRNQGLDRRLLLVAEHTWGLDQKIALPDVGRWDRGGLAAVRASDAGRRFEASWAEQRAYVPGGMDAPRLPPEPSPADEGYQRIDADSELTTSGWRVAVARSGALTTLESGAAGRRLADVDHPLGLLAYQSFDEADYERFWAQLTPVPEDEGWARRDNTKPGIDACGAVHGTWHPDLSGAWIRDDPAVATSEVLVEVGFAGMLADALGAPRQVWLRWILDRDEARADLTVWWTEKSASRLPEALWCSFNPIVAEPDAWMMDKLGQEVSPLDVVRRGGRSLHAVGDGLRYRGPDGSVQIVTYDAPLVAPGAPNLLDADPPVPDLSGGFHVLLHDNCWGTNFPMWNEGPMTYRFSLSARAPSPGTAAGEGSRGAPAPDRAGPARRSRPGP